MWIAVGLAAVPWIATPTVMIPIQARLAANGPETTLVQELVWNDVLLRLIPPFIQSMILFVAVLQSFRRNDVHRLERDDSENHHAKGKCHQ
jgi:hypothetical protein